MRKPHSTSKRISPTYDLSREPREIEEVKGVAGLNQPFAQAVQLISPFYHTILILTEWTTSSSRDSLVHEAYPRILSLSYYT